MDDWEYDEQTASQYDEARAELVEAWIRILGEAASYLDITPKGQRKDFAPDQRLEDLLSEHRERHGRRIADALASRARIAGITRDLEARADLILGDRVPPEYFDLVRHAETQNVFVGGKPVHLGRVNKLLSIPTAPRLQGALLFVVVDIQGERDVLLREHHDGFGWHYHYAWENRKRSDTLLSFDVSREEADTDSLKKMIKPLCWEHHAVAKAAFDAKPWLWGTKKRRSIYRACAPDLRRHDPSTFKRPSREAADVWPL